MINESNRTLTSIEPIVSRIIAKLNDENLFFFFFPWYYADMSFGISTGYFFFFITALVMVMIEVKAVVVAMSMSMQFLLLLMGSGIIFPSNALKKEMRK